ncbi:ATP-binding protein [Streptomyces sp. 1222.5]|uniref:ATP-binding protein n=1 Tax=Streptomyces sp. 1222.5 TaxID=1881026 RepID=UPI003EBB1DFA
MYATIDSDRCTNQLHATAAEPQRETNTEDSRTVSIPRPRRPLNEVSKALHHCPQAASAARHTVRSVLASWRVTGETVDVLVLIVSELVTNSIEYAQPPLAVHLYREYTSGRVWVGVSDGGPVPNNQARMSADKHGCDYTILDKLTDAHGTRTHSDGHATHWARLGGA